MLCLILLIATALRVIHLDSPTLWWDEGNNAYFAHLTPTELLHMSRVTLETDPPVHRLALHVWLATLGDSVLNLRLLSAVCGVLTVALTYAWGRRLGGTRVGLLAAALMAIWPLHIHYSREAKAYPWVTLWAGLSAYLWLCYVDPEPHSTRRRRLAWFGAALGAFLSLGAHFYAALWIAAQGLGLAILLGVNRTAWSEAWRRLLRWGSVQAAAVVGVLPWVLLTFATTMRGAERLPDRANTDSLAVYMREIGGSLATTPAAYGWACALAAVILLTAIAVAIWRKRKGREIVLLALVLTPLALGFAAQQSVGFLHARFLLYLTPPAAVLAAEGLLRLRKIGWAVGLALVIAWGASMAAAYAPFAKPEDDLRPLAQALASNVRAGDAVVVTYIWQEGMLRMEMPQLPVTYHLGWFSQEGVAQEIEPMWGAQGRLWLLTYRVGLQHPVNTGGWWLEHNAARAFLTQQGPYNLALYLHPPSSNAPLTKRADFEGQITLAAGPLHSVVRIGDALPFTLACTLGTVQGSDDAA
ncbi:MAG: glycosyltransferase family 39 protein [Gammaproteobacteria bacterium]|nr:glycosyltransferase family 39 protein [Gammaproteobacteria bacterium]